MLSPERIIQQLEAALARAAADLRKVGDDYPHSSCQQWCYTRAAEAEHALTHESGADRATRYLRSLMVDDGTIPVPAKDIFTMARAEGLNRDLIRRAKSRLHLVSLRSKTLPSRVVAWVPRASKPQTLCHLRRSTVEE